MEFILTDENGIEIGPLRERDYIDIDCGNDNTFEIQVTNDYYKKLGISDGWRLGVQGKEYGGIIRKIITNTETNLVSLAGPTWRGMLEKKIVEPPSGEDYRIVSGDANTIINDISCAEFDGIFICAGASGIQVNNFQFDRYVTHLAGLEKMLLSQNARLDIAYDSGEPNGASVVKLEAVPIKDYSDEIEYSQDGTLSFLSFTFENYSGGINHLICLGKGELKERLVLHLYADENGNIGTEQHFFGADEREAVYNYSSAGTEEDLRKNGTEKFKELLSYKSMDMDLFNETLAGLRGINDDISIGDIVGGRDFDTGIYLSKQITRKIVQVKNGRESIEYGVGKPVLNRNSSNAPVEQSDPLDKLIKVTADGTGVSIGKDAELSNVFDVGLAPIFRNTIGLNIPDGTDIAKAFTSWSYGVLYRQNEGITVSNAPDGCNTGQYIFYYRFATFLIANLYSGHFYIVDTTNGVFNNGWQDLRIPNKVRAGNKASMWTDNEGGNLELRSPNDVLWQFDAHDNNLRLCTFGTDGVYRSPFSIGCSDGGVDFWQNIGVWGDLYAQKGFCLSGNWMTDLVVAQGSSGIWQYRKYASGMAECWGQTSYMDLSVQSGTYGWYNSMILTLPFTLPLIYTVNITAFDGGAGVIADGSCGQVTISQLTIHIKSPLSGAKASAFVHVLGYWK